MREDEQATFGIFVCVTVRVVCVYPKIGAGAADAVLLLNDGKAGRDRTSRQ